MTVRRTSCIALFLLQLFSFRFAGAAETTKPKLVVAIIIDQFRYDYLTRFRGDYHGGLDQMLREGADFTNAFYAQVPTVTAVGHSIFMSGAMPAMSGMVSNSWYDRNAQQVVTSVCDWNEKVVGGSGEQPKQGSKCTDSDPASPRRLLVSTLGDEIRNANPNAKVIGVSIKARGAILPSGHRAKGAFWFDDATGNFVSSTYYMAQLPEWAASFNAEKRPAKYVDQAWDGFPKWKFHAAAGSEPYSKLPASPWGNELIEGFAEKAVIGAKLGQTEGATDLLTVSFSSNDYVGHAVGPDAPEVRDMAVRADALLGKFFALLDKQVGMKNVVVVLSADHGVATSPVVAEKEKLPGGFIAADLEDVVTSALNRKFGKAEWLIPGGGETSLYFNWDEINKVKTSDGKTPSEEDVYRAAEDALLAQPLLHVARVYSRRQLSNGVAGDLIAQAEMNGFFPRRSGDLMLVFDSGYLPGTSGTTHFSPYAYDRHVPVVFMGMGVKGGRYDETIRPNDIAPTLATMLDVQTPSGSSGRVLSEMIAR